MRDRLSALITDYAVNDPRVIVLSGDHGYALFDSVRSAAPDQFINVGVAEQSMIGISAGLARAGYLPIAYGLASFIPIRVLEQIKLDLCLSKLPVLLLGDGAGLVYSTLGSSHQCGEDIAALRPMPGVTIYSPADGFELESCFRAAMRGVGGPAYLRIGKSGRKDVHTKIPDNTGYVAIRKTGAKTVLVGTGSMSSTAVEIGATLGLDAVSVIRIKPFPERLVAELFGYEKVFVLEEHHRAGGLFSAIAESLALSAGHGRTIPNLFSIAMKDQFSRKCGSHEYALSEHDLTNSQIESFIRRSLG